MDIKEKQAIWLKEKPLFEAELIHSHLLPFFHFNENTGDYEIKTESVNNTDEEDLKVAYESLNTGWAMWLRAKRTAKTQVPEGFVLVPKKPDVDKAWDIALKRIVPPPKTNDAIQQELMCKKYVDDLCSEQDRILLDYEAMIEAQEQSHD